MRPHPRPALILALSSLLAGCVGEVGGGTASRGRGQNAEKDAHSDHGDCATSQPQKLTQSITIRAATDFDKLPKGCWDLQGTLRLEGPAVMSLDKLGELIAVDALEIVDTNLMSTIDSKKQIEVYGSILVTGNNRLKDLDHVVAEKWGTITTASVTIRNNAELATLGGVRYLKDVVGALQISDNPKLASIALDELTAAGSVQVTTNATLATLDLGSLTKVGRVEIASNAMLKTLDVGAAVDIGDLVVRGNGALTNLGTWSALTNVKGSLTIDGNNTLVDFNGFTPLQYVTGSVAITNNIQLTSIAPMGRLQGIGSTVNVSGNILLSSCGAIEIDYCVNSGAVSIGNNKPNTNNINNCPLFWCEL